MFISLIYRCTWYLHIKSYIVARFLFLTVENYVLFKPKSDFDSEGKSTMRSLYNIRKGKTHRDKVGKQSLIT